MRAMGRCAAVAFALLAALAGAAHGHEPARGARSAPRPTAPARLPVIRAAADFTLADSMGVPVRLTELRGQVVLVSFTYLSCPGACPIISQRMALVHRELARRGLAGERVTLLSITVDPERDDAAALARQARALGAGRGWRWLGDAVARVRPVLEAYHEWTRVLSGGEIDHPARLYLIDPRGRIREIYALAFFDTAEALRDIDALLGE